MSHSLLVVSDDPNMLELSQLVLRFNGYDVHVARSAAEAETVAARHEVDLVVADQRARRVQGRSIAHQLLDVRALGPVPLLVINGLCVGTNSVSHITDGLRPITLETLLDEVSSFFLPAAAVRPLQQRPVVSHKRWALPRVG